MTTGTVAANPVTARAVLSRAPEMNQITFGTKRAFHGVLRGTRKLLASFGLTAARFDMLYALMGPASRRGSSRALYQSELRRKLGVTASVVSRMARALESLGWVKRRVPLEGDRRQRSVALTEEGEARMRAARRVVVRSVHRLVLDAICLGRAGDPLERFVRMDTLEGSLRALRRDFGDRASLYFPWGHPDD